MLARWYLLNVVDEDSFLPARRSASAGTRPTYGRVSSVCLSVTSRWFMETDERIELVWQIPSTYPTLR